MVKSKTGFPFIQHNCHCHFLLCAFLSPLFGRGKFYGKLFLTLNNISFNYIYFVYANKLTTKSIFFLFTCFFLVAPAHSHTAQIGCDWRNMSVNFSVFFFCFFAFSTNFHKVHTIINQLTRWNSMQLCVMKKLLWLHHILFQYSHTFYTLGKAEGKVWGKGKILILNIHSVWTLHT